MTEHKEMRLYLSESGKKGVERREKNRADKPTIKGGLSTPSTDKIRKDNISVNVSFDVFWNLYDYKKGNKDKLTTKWCNLKDDEREKIIASLPAYIKSTPDKKFRKYPETYLNNKSWNDEVIIHQLKPASRAVNDGRPVN